MRKGAHEQHLWYIPADAPNAPATQPKPKGIPCGNKRQLTITLDPDLLERADGIARRMGVSRASFMQTAIYPNDRGLN